MSERGADERVRQGCHGSSIGAVSDFVLVAGSLPAKRLVVAGGDRVGDLKLVEACQDHGIVERVLLVGDVRRVRDAVAQTGIVVAHDDVIAADGPEHTAETAAEIVRRGDADIVMKGGIPTSSLFKVLLRTRDRRTVNVVTCFDALPVADGRLLLFTDPALAISCTYERLVDMIENAVEVARLVLGRAHPRVALLSISEEHIPSLPSSEMAVRLSMRRWEGMEVYGPLSLDLAVDPESVSDKRLLTRFPQSAQVAGHADILICPGIDCANILYKSVMEMSKEGIAGIASTVVGLACPVVAVSRADTLASRLASLALSCTYAERRGVSAVPRASSTCADSEEEPVRATDKTSANLRRGWMLRATVLDTAGATTGILSAFSNRGINIDTIVGHGGEDHPKGTGTVIITFRCDERTKDRVRREVERLRKVVHVEEHAYRDDSPRKGAVLVVKPEQGAARIVEETSGIKWDLIRDETVGRTYFIAGPPETVDLVLDRMVKAGMLLDIVST